MSNKKLQPITRKQARALDLPMAKMVNTKAFSEDQRENVERRLLARIIKQENGCWECTFSLAAYQYPQISIRRKNFRAHCVAYWLWNGDIPNGLFVCHSCDNPRCVNPTHLWLGTAADNVKDMCEKGRNAIGDKNGSRLHPERVPKGDRHSSKTHPEKLVRGEKVCTAKLTDEDIRWIRMWRNEGFSNISIAKSFNVHDETIRRIVNRKIWKHIT